MVGYCISLWNLVFPIIYFWFQEEENSLRNWIQQQQPNHVYEFSTFLDFDNPKSTVWLTRGIYIYLLYFS